MMLNADERVRLAYGLALPEGVTTAWGARLIAPSDLLHDRQDLVAADDESKAKLIAWLNGTPAGTGAIREMQERLVEMRYSMPDGGEFVAYEDEHGKVIADTRRSCGYVYVAGWLK